MRSASGYYVPINSSWTQSHLTIFYSRCFLCRIKWVAGAYPSNCRTKAGYILYSLSDTYTPKEKFRMINRLKTHFSGLSEKAWVPGKNPHVENMQTPHNKVQAGDLNLCLLAMMWQCWQPNRLAQNLINIQNYSRLLWKRNNWYHFSTELQSYKINIGRFIYTL